MEALNTTHDALIDEAELEGVVKQFEQWRASRRKIERIPEPLWQAAASLYPRYTVFRIARALRLDFVDLRDRIHPKGRRNRSLNRKGAVGAGSEVDGLHFMELPAAPIAGLSECSVRMKDGPGGTRITIRLKGAGVGQLLEMLRGLWSRAQ
jgi:hypothetical protein